MESTEFAVGDRVRILTEDEYLEYKKKIGHFVEGHYFGFRPNTPEQARSGVVVNVASTGTILVHRDTLKNPDPWKSQWLVKI